MTEEQATIIIALLERAIAAIERLAAQQKEQPSGRGPFLEGNGE